MGAILVIEDDPDIVELLKINLQDLNLDVQTCQDGRQGLEWIDQQSYDLIILDIMLPGINGIDICKHVRQNDQQTPILMLTAKSEEIDKVLGLELGADDYVVKPFSIRELKARIKALIRRTSQNQSKNQTTSEVLFYEHMEIDLPKRKVLIANEKVELSRREFDLLALLASNPGISFSRSRLLNQVWGYDFDGFEHTVNTHINRLRSKIERDMDNPQYILTTWGIGYRFNEDLQITHHGK